jgi:hypothetical protein
MSSFLSQARARALGPGVSLPKPRLTIVPRVAARAPRVPFVLLVVTLLIGGLVGLLLLNTALQRGAYRVTGLQDKASALALKQQALQTEVANLQQPRRVAQQAVRLGMVQNDSPAFISLSSGRTVGSAVAGMAGNQFDLGRQPTPGRGRTKQQPLTGGEANSASTGVTVHRAPKPPAAARSADTSPGNHAEGGAQAARGPSTTGEH